MARLTVLNAIVFAAGCIGAQTDAPADSAAQAERLLQAVPGSRDGEKEPATEDTPWDFAERLHAAIRALTAHDASMFDLLVPPDSDLRVGKHSGEGQRGPVRYGRISRAELHSMLREAYSDARHPLLQVTKAEGWFRAQVEWGSPDGRWHYELHVTLWEEDARAARGAASLCFLKHSMATR